MFSTIVFRASWPRPDSTASSKTCALRSTHPARGVREGIDSERGIEWRCADSLSLREFLLLDTGQAVPDHSSLSRIRSRLPLQLHQEVFTWVLGVITEAGLVQGDRIDVDASTMEANAAMRSIVRKDTG